MDYQVAQARTDLEVGDDIILNDGTPDRIDRARFIQELTNPNGKIHGTAWFEFHLYSQDRWVKREDIRGRLKPGPARR